MPASGTCSGRSRRRCSSFSRFAAAKPMPAERPARARLKLLLIAAVCALPFAAAWVVYLLDLAPGAPSNYGELLAPQQPRGAAFAALRGKWVLVSFDPGNCDAYC